jgi:hypothetical protein
MVDDRIAQFLPGIATIGEDMAEPREASAYCLEQINGAVAALDVGCMHENEDQKAGHIGGAVILATFDLLGHVIASNTAAFCGPLSTGHR